MKSFLKLTTTCRMNQDFSEEYVRQIYCCKCTKAMSINVLFYVCEVIVTKCRKKPEKITLFHKLTNNIYTKAFCNFSLLEDAFVYQHFSVSSSKKKHNVRIFLALIT